MSFRQPMQRHQRQSPTTFQLDPLIHQSFPSTTTSTLHRIAATAPHPSTASPPTASHPTASQVAWATHHTFQATRDQTTTPFHQSASTFHRQTPTSIHEAQPPTQRPQLNHCQATPSHLLIEPMVSPKLPPPDTPAQRSAKVLFAFPHRANQTESDQSQVQSNSEPHLNLQPSQCTQRQSRRSFHQQETSSDQLQPSSSQAVTASQLAETTQKQAIAHRQSIPTFQQSNAAIQQPETQSA